MDVWARGCGCHRRPRTIATCGLEQRVVVLGLPAWQPIAFQRETKQVTTRQV